MHEFNPNIDIYLAEGCGRCPLGASPECKVHDWQDELKYLRPILIESGLFEEHKWGVPCYTLKGKNVIILSAFKEYCGLSFFKGALLDHSSGLLEKPGPNSQSSRVIKFRSVNEIVENEPIIKALIFEAIEVENAGLSVELKKDPEPIPQELQQKLDSDPLLNDAWNALTPGRQRGYILYFSQAKQSKTIDNRIEKYIPLILNGQGMHDKYQSSRKK